MWSLSIGRNCTWNLGSLNVSGSEGELSDAKSSKEPITTSCRPKGPFNSVPFNLPSSPILILCSRPKTHRRGSANFGRRIFLHVHIPFPQFPIANRNGAGGLVTVYLLSSECRFVLSTIPGLSKGQVPGENAVGECSDSRVIRGSESGAAHSLPFPGVLFTSFKYQPVLTKFGRRSW